MIGQIQTFEDMDSSKGNAKSILHTVKGILDSVHSFYPCFSGGKGLDFAQKSWVFESFDRFRGIVWRKHFSALKREDLCSVSVPSCWKESSNTKELAVWEKELEAAWSNMLHRFPTFVIYFCEGGYFSADSLKAFSSALRKMQDLEWEKGCAAQVSLFLSGMKIDDQGIQAISKDFNAFKSVVHLDLKDNDMTDVALFELIEVLRTNTTLLTLDLYGSIFSEEAVLALIDVLESNHSLKSLTLSTDCVSLKAAKAFENLRKKNPHIENLDIWR